MVKKASYLGDGVYIEDEGFQFKLHTQQGDEIYMEDSVVEAFFRFIEQAKGLKITVTVAQ